MNLWLIVIAAGIGTYAIRLSWLVLAHHSVLPPLARDALRFVTPAVMAAIILPAVLYTGADDDLSIAANNERLIAALAATAIAWATRNVWATIGGGMAVLWALKALGG